MIARLYFLFSLLFWSSILLGNPGSFQNDPAPLRKKVKEKPAYWVAIDPNFGLGILDVEGIAVAGLQNVHGLKFGDHFSAGLGLGLHLYESERFVPIFTEARGYFGKGETKFMMGFSLGTYRALDEAEWEPYTNPFIGFTYQAFEHVVFSFSLGIIYKRYNVPLEPVRLPGGGVRNLAGTREITGEFFAVRFGCYF